MNRIISTDFNFGRYIHKAHPNKSPLKFGKKWSVGVSRVYYLCGTFITSGTGKAMDFKFCTHIHSVDLNKIT